MTLNFCARDGVRHRREVLRFRSRSGLRRGARRRRLSPAGAAWRTRLPAEFKPRVDTFDYTRRDVMIPMRDGVKLKTLILIPRGAEHAPILLTRTPYGATERIEQHASAHLSEVIGNTDVADDAVIHGGYIRVMQDVRGKHGSEGDYAMTRPLRGPLNPTEVDHATDTYDTIDWLVKNIPESNGKVGILGISYDGFTSLMALVNPHPALRAAVPINAMVDGWMGDDWFHKGAFRQNSLIYFHDQEATRGEHAPLVDRIITTTTTPGCRAGSAGDMARLHGLDQVGFAGKVMSHPAYDSFWQDQALDKILAARGVTVPTMLVHSLWDQEDIYGNIALYKALESQPGDHSNLFLVLGPWFHHQERLDGSRVGAIEFGSDTAQYFRLHILRPFLDHYLKDDAPPLAVAPVNAFETGTNRWLELAALALRVRRKLQHRQPKDVFASRRRARPDGIRRPAEFRIVRIRPGEAGSLPAAADQHVRTRRRERMADLAGERSARGRVADRRAQLLDARAPETGQDHRASPSRTWSPRPAAPTPISWSS